MKCILSGNIACLWKRKIKNRIDCIKHTIQFVEKVQNIVKVELSIDISNVLNYTFSKKSRRRETCMTIKDIAKNLNVSYSTVSLSLNNDPRVAEKTKNVS